MRRKEDMHTHTGIQVSLFVRSMLDMYRMDKGHVWDIGRMHVKHTLDLLCVCVQVRLVGVDA